MPSRTATCLGDLPRIKTPSAEAFRRDYLDPQRPVVIRGAMDTWPAMSTWSAELFVERFADREVPVAVLNADNVTRFHDVRRLSCREYFTAMSQPAPLVRYYLVIGQITSTQKQNYLTKAALPDYFPELIDDVHLPSFVPRERLHNVNLWCGYDRTTTHLHFDMADNLHGVVRGRKRFLLFHPAELRHLYPYSIFQTKEQTHYSRVDPDHPDTVRYPRYAKARYHEVVLEPGEMLYIPQAYWHHVTSLGFCMAVNIWYSTPPSTRRFLEAPLLRSRRWLGGQVSVLRHELRKRRESKPAG